MTQGRAGQPHTSCLRWLPAPRPLLRTPTVSPSAVNYLLQVRSIRVLFPLPLGLLFCWQASYVLLQPPDLIYQTALRDGKQDTASPCVVVVSVDHFYICASSWSLALLSRLSVAALGTSRPHWLGIWDPCSNFKLPLVTVTCGRQRLLLSSSPLHWLSPQGGVTTSARVHN